MFIASFIDKTLYALAFIILFASPLRYGAVQPSLSFFFQSSAFLMLFLLIFRLLIMGKPLSIGFRSYTFIVAFLALCIFQLIPLPSFFLASIAPKSLEIWQRNSELLAGIGALHEKRFFEASIYPEATWNKTLLVLSYLSFGFVISNHFRTRRQILFLLGVAFSLSLIEAVIGLLQYLASESSAGEAGGYARGTFYNKNHFAGLLEMTIPLAFGYVVSMGGWMEQKGFSLRHVVSGDYSARHVTLILFIALMLAALVFSGSRSGIVSLLLALCFFFLLAKGVRGSSIGRSSLWVSFSLFVFLGASFVLWIGLYPVFEHFLSAKGDAPVRLLLWKDALRVYLDFPILGSGFGTFRYVYPLYKDSMELPMAYSYAHNDYLEVLAETGFLGFAALVGALVFMLHGLITKVLGYHGSSYGFRVPIAAGAITGVVSILIHSLTDFNLQIPSNGFYFSFLIGLAVSCLSGCDEAHPCPGSLKSCH